MKLIKGDCLKVMDQMVEAGVKVDAIITDPPYGTTACKWDSVIPFEPMWERLKQVRKERTPIVLFGVQPFFSTLITSNIKEYRQEIIWEKPNITNFFYVKKQIAKKHENIGIFYKKAPCFNPSKIKAEKLTNNKAAGLRFDNHQGAIVKSGGWAETGERYQGSVYKCSHDPEKSISNKGKQNRHPTQKPVALMEYLIKTYTNEGDLVLDFTMGSGTTGVACKNLNRDFIGIEQDEKYFKIAEERINNYENL